MKRLDVATVATFNTQNVATVASVYLQIPPPIISYSESVPLNFHMKVRLSMATRPACDHYVLAVFRMWFTGYRFTLFS